MPKLFKLNENKLFEKIETKEFKDERKELRDLFRKNMENNFFPNLKFLDTEYYISGGKKSPAQRKIKGGNKKERNFVDTICYYEKERSFILFEYKNNAADGEKVIQQISDYIRLLKDNTNDSQNKLIEKFYSDDPQQRKIPFWKKSDYNWHLTKGICVSSSFTDGQLGLIDDLGLFVMWAERYKNDCWIIEKDSGIEWLKTEEKTELLKPKISPIDREPPKWVEKLEKLEKWINEEVKNLVSEYSFEIKKTSNGTYSCPPNRKISFLTIAYKNPWNSKLWTLTPKIYLAEPSKNLIDQFSLQKKEGTNCYYEIIDKKGNENFQKALDLINSYLQEK